MMRAGLQTCPQGYSCERLGSPKGMLCEGMYGQKCVCLFFT
jgi:hypothetical protein